jgi:hypothetical protein
MTGWLPDPVEDDEKEDCLKIQKVIKDRSGQEVSLKLCELIWRDFSEAWCATWLFLPRSGTEANDNEEIWHYVRHYI